MSAPHLVMAPELLPPGLSEGDMTIEELIGYHKQVLECIRQMGVDECVFPVFSSALERLAAQVGLEPSIAADPGPARQDRPSRLQPRFS